MRTRCPFCKKKYFTENKKICECGAYKIIPGFESKNFKDQPYNTFVDRNSDSQVKFELPLS